MLRIYIKWSMFISDVYCQLTIISCNREAIKCDVILRSLLPTKTKNSSVLSDFHKFFLVLYIEKCKTYFDFNGPFCSLKKML